MKKLVAVLSVLSTFGLLSTTAHADDVQMTLTGTPGAVVNGVYVYPYDFTVQNNTTSVTTFNVPLMCISYLNEISMFETWDATKISLPSTLNDRALAIIDADIIASLAANDQQKVDDDQFAAWGIGDPALVLTAAQLAIENTALAEAAIDTNAADYAGFSEYVPTGVGSPQGTVPQTFIGYDGSTPFVPHLVPTPEPSSLALLGTGVIGVAGIFRRRFTR